ncbi:MAG: hypothetical protein GX818_02745 [Tissierellia bacterium]|jgi:hypothetical protein|nr:hypothetical protein [Tissierellia bacterium]
MQIENKYYSFENKVLVYESENDKLTICNFYPQVTSAVKIGESNNADNIEVNFVLLFNGEKASKQYTYTLSEILSLDWSKIDYRCVLNNNQKISVIKKHLSAIIQWQVVNGNVLNEIPVYNQMGWGMFYSNPSYLAGKTLITSSGIVSNDKYKCEDALKDYILEIDTSLDVLDTAKYIMNMMLIAPGVSDILVANLISGLLRDMFVKVGIIPRFVCYLVGAPQTRKTTIACHTSSIYNRSTNDEFLLINLLSSSSAVHRSISRLKDCCYIVDDLYKTDRKQDMQIREARLSEVIRTIGNNAGKATTKGKEINKIPPNCNVVCTAEYLLEGYSTLSRCVIIRVDKAISSESLSKSQLNPKALSTFIYHFILWCCKEYNNNLNFIKMRWNKYKERRALRTNSTERQNEAGFILNTSMRLLIKYIKDNGLYDDTICNPLRDLFNKSLRDLIKRQKEDMQRIKSSNDEMRYTRLIAQAYCNKSISLEKKKGNLSKKSHGIIHKDNLCLSPEFVLHMAIDHYKDYTITTNKIHRELKKYGLLDIDDSNRSTKKINGIRLLHIPIQKLEAFIDENGISEKGSLLSRIKLDNIDISDGRLRL